MVSIVTTELLVLKDMVKDNKQVHFQYYSDSTLWYKTECGFVFPVPVSDIGNGTHFLSQDKALLFMRYIRAYIKQLKENKYND